MAKAYWIAHVTVTDPEQYKGYMQAAPAAFQKFGAKFLARGGESLCLEGEDHERNVVIEFDSLERAKACYHSLEYQAAKAKRDGACHANVIIVEALA